MKSVDAFVDAREIIESYLRRKQIPPSWAWAKLESNQIRTRCEVCGEDIFGLSAFVGEDGRWLCEECV